MIRKCCWLSWLVLAAAPLTVSAQGKTRDVHVIFKDGFSIKGKVHEAIRDFIYDPASGRSFSIPSGDFSIDDHVRNVLFSPSHVHTVRQIKAGEVKDPIKIVRIKNISQTREIHSTWLYTSFGKWNEEGERTVMMRSGKGDITLKQKIGVFTPHYLYAVTEDYVWDLRYSTQEFGPELTRAMLMHLYAEKKDLKGLKPADKFLGIAAFMQEAGWFKEAEKELENIVANFPADKEVAEKMLVRLRKDRADLFVESIKQAAKVGQHNVAIERLDDYDKREYPKIVSPEQRAIAADLKTDYENAKVYIEQAQKYLKDFPGYTPGAKKAVWAKTIEFIADELNYDTIDRLDEFLKSAKQYERQRKDKVNLTQTAEQVLATAVSGWLQGNSAALPDVKSALKLAGAREFLLQFFQPDNDLKRPGLVSGFKVSNDLPIDVMTRLIRMIPPPDAHPVKEINTDVQTIKIAGGNGGTYLLQLPPDYHHQRAYPVLMIFHSGRDSAEETLKRFSEEGAKHGFILAAPLWGNNKAGRAKYKYSQSEHDLVLDTLRDLRRRFQIDSDRVGMFGWEDGANLAFDVGLGHPDQFAGVVPMNGTVTTFAKRFYWPNAQYLPFYVIEGERNGGRAKLMRELFKEWTRDPYTSMYVEYKGRASEWFSAEIPQLMNWMSKKKRYMPVKEMGRPNFASGLGEEFHSSRNGDNRFYWLSCDSIADRCQKHPTETEWRNFQPATFQANLSVGNSLVKSSGEAKIWNRANLRVNGARQLSFWITPEMMGTSKKWEIFVNGQIVGGMRDITPSLDVLLNEVYQTGDRQRVFVAKIEIK
jgi:pimeloyl-ACP methyl ester carboxylesterase